MRYNFNHKNKYKNIIQFTKHPNKSYYETFRNWIKFKGQKK